jgi:hypothetical protein
MKYTAMFISWLPLAIVILCGSGLIYAAGQQVLRQSANDPQIQLAEDIASGLAAGRKLADTPADQKAEISTSLSPFIVVFDVIGKPTVSTGLLHNKMPDLPKGVFSYAKTYGEDRFTWQPEAGVRIAAVVKSYTVHEGGGFVLAGRSLREVEKRSDQLLKISILGGIIILGASLIAVIPSVFFKS